MKSSKLTRPPPASVAAATATATATLPVRRNRFFTNLAAAAAAIVLVLLVFLVLQLDHHPLPAEADAPRAVVNGGTHSATTNRGLDSRILHLFNRAATGNIAAMALLRSLLTAGALVFALPGATSASSSLLYVASYSGTITTFNLTLPGKCRSTGASLQPVATNGGCAPNPSWLTLDHANSTLYCLDEGLNVRNGSLSSYITADDGSLVQVDKITTIKGPVSGVIYGTGGRGIALAE